MSSSLTPHADDEVLNSNVQKLESARLAKFVEALELLYIIGNTLYYKATENDSPLSFDLTQCTAQQEPNWRMLKWFSVTTPVGEKHYFNSHKMGAFVNNSDETLRGLAVIHEKIAEVQQTV